MFAKTNNPVKRAFRRYNVELGVSMVAYFAAMFFRGNLLHGPHFGPIQDPGRSLQAAILLMPVVPLVAVFAAVFRLIRRIDERLYRQFVDSLAIAGGITSLLAAGYGLIEGEVVPFPSAWWTYMAFGGSWAVASLIVRWRY